MSKRGRRTKTGQLFRTIFVIQCLLLVCVLSYVTILMNTVVRRAQEQELDASYLRLLERQSRSLTDTVDRQVEQTRLFLAESQIMRYLVNPGQEEISDRMDILQMLKRYAELSAEIRHLWLYRPMMGDVLSSDGYFTPREESAAAVLLERYETSKRIRSDSDLFLSAIPEDGKLFLILEFAPAARLGSFVYQLEYQRLGTPAEEDREPVLIVDGGGTLLMEGVRLEPEGGTYDLEDGSLYYTAASEKRLAGQKYYRVDNERLGWSLLLEMPGRSVIFRSTAFWTITLPVLAVLFLLGAAAAWLITRQIYEPINRLMAQAAGSREVPAGVEYEPDYLEAAWEQTIEDNTELRSKVSSLGLEMRRYFCRQAAEGRLDENEDPVTWRAVIPDGVFQAVAVRVTESRLGLERYMRDSLLHRALKKKAEQSADCLCALDMDHDLLALIFCRPAGEDPDVEAAAKQFLAKAEQELSCRLAAGFGLPCRNFRKLEDSCRQAEQDLRVRMYMTGKEKDAPRLQTLKEQALDERLMPLIEEALVSRKSAADFAEQLVQAAEHGAADEAERLYGYRRAQDLLLEKLMFREDAATEFPGLRGPGTPREEREAYLAWFEKAVLAGREITGKKQYRYVEEGKAYLQANYQNSSLSVSDVSAHIGISTTYFSSLFNEMTQESVTSYLNRLRVEQARRMLAATHISAQEIGFRCGFNSANVFSRVFKKYTGQTPGQYRDSCAGKAGGV